MTTNTRKCPHGLPISKGQGPNPDTHVVKTWSIGGLVIPEVDRCQPAAWEVPVR